MWSNRNSSGNTKWCSHFGKRVWQFLTKSNIHLSYNLTTRILGIYQGEVKACVHTTTCTWAFFAASFALTPNQQQHECPSAREINKPMGSIHAVEYYAAVEKGYQYGQRQRWISKPLCRVKEAVQKRRNTVLFHSYDILEQGNLTYGNGKGISGRLGLRVGKSKGSKEKGGHFGEQKNYYVTTAVVVTWLYAFF